MAAKVTSCFPIAFPSEAKADADLAAAARDTIKSLKALLADKNKLLEDYKRRLADS